MNTFDLFEVYRVIQTSKPLSSIYIWIPLAKEATSLEYLSQNVSANKFIGICSILSSNIKLDSHCFFKAMFHFLGIKVIMAFSKPRKLTAMGKHINAVKFWCWVSNSTSNVTFCTQVSFFAIFYAHLDFFASFWWNILDLYLHCTGHTQNFTWILWVGFDC